MNHLVWIFSVLLFSLCKAQIPERPSLGADYDDGTTLNQGGEVFDSDPLLYLNLGGSPGVDFPMYRKIPKTSFSCKNVKASGYYADMETNCQVFHLCENGEKLSFLCPNGTIFRQSRLTCDWWYKVDCGTSLEFYESSAEQLRQDRTTPKGEKSSRPRPLNFDDDRKVNNLESQVFAETGSLIISRQKSAKKFFESKSVPVTAEVTTVKSTGRFEVRKPKLNSPVQTTFGNKHSIYTPTVPPITSTTKSTTTSTTTTEPTTTEVPTTTYEITTYKESEQRSEGESLQGSHSSWFSSAATDPPVTESTIPELVNTLQNERRSDEGRAGRAQRLEDVPLVARPETLHSLATYFAADNKTRVELEKMVPEDQKILMEKIVREQKQLNPSLDTSDPNLRQLAKIFSKALTDYLHDPESFRETLSAVHPTQPPLPLVSDNLLLDEDKDEVLDFSDAPQTKPQRLVTTTPEPYTSTPFTPVTVRRNDVATKINEILDVPSGRRAPDGLFVTPSDFASPLDAETRGYLPSTSAASANLVDAIPTPTSFPNPESIPFDPPSYYPQTRDYVEIGFQPSLIQAPTGRGFFEPAPGLDLHPHQPPYDVNHFLPSDLNSLSILNIETHHSPTQPPVSVSVHIPKGIDHRVTIVSSPENLQLRHQPSAPSSSSSSTQNRPMISKLLFPLPSESLVSEGTASFPSDFSSSKSQQQLLENTIEGSGISTLVTQTIPSPTTPATTVEPITEYIPSTSEEPTTISTTLPTTTLPPTTTEIVARARKIDDKADDSKLVLLLLKNGATTPGPATPFISKTMLIEALLKSQQEKAEDVPQTGVNYAETTTSSAKLVSTNEATTYRSAKHAEILQRIQSEIAKKEQEQSTSETLPEANSLVTNSNGAQKERTARGSLNHSDSRALDILKSLYSLASRWI